MPDILESKITGIGRSALHQRGDDETVYGSYAHLHLAMSLRADGPLAAPGDMDALLSTEPDPARILDAAMSSVTPIHELRHFHDCFGTVASATYFLNYLSLLREFYALLLDLKSAGIAIRLPLAAWTSHSDCPDSVKRFLNRAREAMWFRVIFNGAFTIAPQEGGDTRPYADFEAWPKCFVPAFPLQIASAKMDRGEFVSHRRRTHWIPIGLDVLLEGNAQALQLGVFQSSGWNLAMEELERSQRIYAARSSDGDISDDGEGALTLPYRITDLMLSKYLRTKHGIHTFPRRWVTQITDAALMMSSMLEFGRKGPMMLPGGAFVMLMESMHISADRQTITLREISPEDLQAFRDSMTACAEPEGVFDVRSPFSAIEYIGCFARHRIIAPMIDLRLKYGHAVFSDLQVYSERFREFPLPPMMIVGGHYRPSRDTDEQFPYVWSRYIMLSDLLRQALQGSSVICCPRAYSTVDGLGSFEYAAPPGCETHIRAMRCGKWSGPSEQNLPRCNFANLTSSLFENSA